MPTLVHYERLVLRRLGRSLAALHFADDLAVEQRQQSIVVRDFLVHNTAVELVARLPEKIPANTQVNAGKYR